MLNCDKTIREIQDNPSKIKPILELSGRFKTSCPLCLRDATLKIKYINPKSTQMVIPCKIAKECPKLKSKSMPKLA